MLNIYLQEHAKIEQYERAEGIETVRSFQDLIVNIIPGCNALMNTHARADSQLGSISLPQNVPSPDVKKIFFSKNEKFVVLITAN